VATLPTALGCAGGNAEIELACGQAGDFTFNGIDWVATSGSPAETSLLTTEADAMHALLMFRADELGGCAEGSVEATELETITDTIERYEAERWPSGRADGGKG
jgi:hypothetical protein